MTHHCMPLQRQSPHSLMETLMTPLSALWRAGRWLIACIALLAFTLPATSARAQMPDAFLKTVEQINCDYVRITIRYTVYGVEPQFADPAFRNTMNNAVLSLEDQLPAGLSFTSANVTGDVTAPGGGPIAPPTFETRVHASDTLVMSDFRMSPDDLDGSGPPGDRSFTVVAIAKINKAALGGDVVVLDNQATFTENGLGWAKSSHDPNVPEDDDWVNGTPTSFTIDVKDCEDGGGGGSIEDLCFKTDTGVLQCADDGSGDLIYKMTFGADKEGQVIELISLTPGVTVLPAAGQIVPPGGGVLQWTIVGAIPGTSVTLLINGFDDDVKRVSGPKEGLGLCCTQRIVIEIPADLECEEPDDYKEPNIRVDKRADVSWCRLTGGCEYTIRVTNDGDAPYTGRIVLEEWQTPDIAAIESGPNAPWTCNPVGWGGGYYCEHPETTLNPGEWVEMKLSFRPGFAWPGDAINNCARFDYAESGVAPFGESWDDRSCAIIPICDPDDIACRDPDKLPEKEPRLEIQKSADPKQCYRLPDGMMRCEFVITIRNSGDGIYNGPITVVDDLDTPVSRLTFSPVPPWSCNPSGGAPDTTWICQRPDLVLGPGAEDYLWVYADISDADMGRFKDGKLTNCAELTHNDHTQNSCDTAELPKPAKMKVEKQCKSGLLGGAISCRISVTNSGASTPTGDFTVRESATDLAGGTAIDVQSITPDGPEWSCGPTPAEEVNCQIPGSSFSPGTTRHIDVTLSITPNQRYRNCAQLVQGEGAEFGKVIGESCVEGGVDIIVEKTGNEICEPGQECKFEITFTNRGTTDFSGPVRVVDVMGPVGGSPFSSVEIVSITPSFGCAVEPTSTPVDCIANMSLAAGESRSHTVIVRVPDSGEWSEAGEGRNCVMATDPSFTPLTNDATATGPGLAENGASNAAACHRFELAHTEDEKPQCSYGMILNDQNLCVCPEGTRWNGRLCAKQDGETDPLPIPTPKPQCRKGWKTFYGKSAVPEGWNSYRLRRGVYCAKKPAQCKLGPNEYRNRRGECVCKRGYDRDNYGRCVRIDAPVYCPKGWQQFPSLKRIPSGWEGKVIREGNSVAYCGRELAYCPKGWKQFPSLKRIPSGWERKVIREGRSVAYCGRKPDLCIPGPNEYRNRQGECVCKRGYDRDNYGRCVRIDAPVYCPKGWQQFPSLKRIPSGWERKVIREGNSVAYCGRELAYCPKGWKQFPSLKRIPNGWQRKVIRKGNSVAYCGRQPDLCIPGPNEYRNSKGQCVCKRGYDRDNYGRCVRIDAPVYCPKGWQQFPSLKRIPSGWERKVIREGNSVAYCGREPAYCPKGWKQFPSLKRIPNGWQRKVIRKGHSVAYCGKEPDQCKPGPNEYRNSKGQCVCKRGYDRDRYGRCVLIDKPVYCPKGWQQFPSLKRVPKGWQRKVVRKGNSVAYCGKKPDRCPRNEVRNRKGECVCKSGYTRDRYDEFRRCVPIQQKVYCPKGWKQFPSAKRIPKGWQRKIIRKGNSVAYCGRQIVDPRPVCKNGKLAKTRKGWQCVCPKGTVRSKIGKNAYSCVRRDCPKGTVGKYPNCRKLTCPKGTVGKYPNCRKLTCPKGTVGKYPNCRKLTCPKGTVGKYPNCRKLTCPKGTVGKWPNCRKLTCPKGTVGKWPNCRKLTCPKGTVGKYPNCKKVQTPCPSGYFRAQNGKCMQIPR